MKINDDSLCSQETYLADVSITVQISAKVNASLRRSACIPHPTHARLCSWLRVLCGRPAPACARRSKHAARARRWQAIFGRGRVAERSIVELELGIDRKPTNMRSKMLTEAERVEHIDKYLQSRHKCDDLAA